MKTGDRETGEDSNSKFWARDNENLSQNSGNGAGEQFWKHEGSGSTGLGNLQAVRQEQEEGKGRR